MKWLDKSIAAFSPEWGAKRAKARLSIKAYEAAQPSRTQRSNRESRSANQATHLAGRSLREQARYLDENHDLVIGIFDKLEERVVGADGIMVEPQPLGSDGKVHREFSIELRRRWAAWSLKPDVTGTFTRPELERLVLRTALRDGECFGRKIRGAVTDLRHPNPNGTMFSIEALEPDFVPFDLNDATKRIRQGIETNAWGQPLAYHVLKTHPGDALASYHLPDRVSAEQVLHLAFRRRLHQVRGITLIHGILTRLNDIKEYEEAERVAARIAACLGFYIKRNGVEADDIDYDSSSREPRHISIEPGMMFDELEPGEDLGMIESNRPNVHLDEFRNGQVRMVAAGARSQYSSISRDYNGTYSAQRQELIESQEGFNVMQNWFVAGWSRPVYREWLRMELLNGLVVPDGVDKNTLFDAVYLAPVMPWINPVHETTAWKERVKGGAASTAQWIRAGGKNPEETWRQIESERRYFEDNNLKFDTLATGDKQSEQEQKDQNTDDDT